MNYDWQMDLRPCSRTAVTVPPATVEETAWDILLALHSAARCEIGLEKLARIVSAPKQALNGWLATLEEQRLITGTANEVTREIRAVLTTAGRDLLDRYLSATNDLQVGSRH